MADDTTHTGQSAPQHTKPNGTSACLIVLAGPRVGEMHKLTTKSTVMGRSENADLRLIDEGISRKHALLVLEEGGVLLRDLGSVNGTFRNGERITGTVPLTDGDKISIGGTTILKFTFQDDVEERFQKNLYASVVKDGLTGLFNRRYFDERLRAEFTFAARHAATLALMLVDIDHFKEVNEARGHQGGDQVLREVARRLSPCLRVEDLIARYGGEEFVVLCRHTTSAQAKVLAERLRSVVTDVPFQIGAEPFTVTVSVGIAVAPAADVNSEAELLHAADTALYEAKRQGRNRSVASSG